MTRHVSLPTNTFPTQLRPPRLSPTRPVGRGVVSTRSAPPSYRVAIHSSAAGRAWMGCDASSCEPALAPHCWDDVQLSGEGQGGLAHSRPTFLSIPIAPARGGLSWQDLARGLCIPCRQTSIHQAALPLSDIVTACALNFSVPVVHRLLCFLGLRAVVLDRDMKDDYPLLTPNLPLRRVPTLHQRRPQPTSLRLQPYTPFPSFPPRRWAATRPTQSSTARNGASAS